MAPKSYFHDAIADHKDEALCQHPQQKAACLHQQGYHCSFSDLVVTTPYLAVGKPYFPGTGIALIPFAERPYTSFFQQCFIHAESRGPPGV